MNFYSQKCILISTALFLAISGCSAAPNKTPDAFTGQAAVGDAPTFFSSAYTAAAIDSNYIVATDEASLQLNEFTLQPFALTHQIPLPFTSRSQQVISDTERQWFLVSSGADFAIIDRSGAANINPVTLLGTVTSISFDNSTDTIVIADSTGALALIQVGPGGLVSGSWVSGPVFSGDQIIFAATMLKGGRFVATLSPTQSSSTETSLLVADIPASIRSSSWVASQFRIPGRHNLSWIAPSVSQENLVIAGSDQQFFSIDISARAVIDSFSVAGRVVAGAYRDLEPHVVIRAGSDVSPTNQISHLGVNPATWEIYYLDSNGMFQSRYVVTANGSMHRTWLETTKDRITVAASDATGKSLVVRQRLSDSLLLAAVPIQGRDNQVAIAPDYIFIQYDSAIGYCERVSYNRATPKEVIREHSLRNLINR